MALSPPELPSELPPNIVECVANQKQEVLLAKLRATCREINAKLLYFFGLDYFKNVVIKLDGPGLSRLEAISKGAFSGYVYATTVDVHTLFKSTAVDDDWWSSDASDCSWYSINAREFWKLGNSRFCFDEGVADLLTNGTGAHVMDQALAKFINLKILRIKPPATVGRMRENKLGDLKIRWLLLSKILLSAAFSQ